MSVRITYFVHATSTDNERNISSGWNDCELSELGRRQAVALREQTRDRRFDVVFCSDLKRACQTARLAWDGMYEIVPDARLRECNYGTLNGAPSEVVEPMQESEAPTNRFPDGESYEDVKTRMAEFLAFLKRTHEGRHIAIVAHKAPQLSLDVLVNGKTWTQALAEDWRKQRAWRPGWEYVVT